MYVLCTDEHGMMDTQMSQESYAFEHENKGILIAARRQPFTTMEHSKKKSENTDPPLMVLQAANSPVEEMHVSQSLADNDEMLNAEVSSEDEQSPAGHGVTESPLTSESDEDDTKRKEDAMEKSKTNQ